jgi:hypothetical protein
MATSTIVLSIFPAIVVGAIIGLVEMFFVHQDEIGMGWFGHGLHAIPFTLFFTFISINTDFALSYFPQIKSTWYIVLGVRVAVALVAMLKIQTAAAIAGRVGEKIEHTFIIGCLIFAVGYFWQFLGQMISPMLPFK